MKPNDPVPTVHKKRGGPDHERSRLLRVLETLEFYSDTFVRLATSDLDQLGKVVADLICAVLDCRIAIVVLDDESGGVTVKGCTGIDAEHLDRSGFANSLGPVLFRETTVTAVCRVENLPPDARDVAQGLQLGEVILAAPIQLTEEFKTKQIAVLLAAAPKGDLDSYLGHPRMPLIALEILAGQVGGAIAAYLSKERLRNEITKRKDSEARFRTLFERVPEAIVVLDVETARIVGLPIPGTDLKMLPNGRKLELRLSGPNITPGYFKRDDLTQQAFDDDGFFKTGDAGTLADPDHPNKGIVFDGRFAEDFKLLTGSWVSTGTLRTAAISACPEVIEDAIVTGHDRDEIGLLIVPNIAGIRKLCGNPPDTELTKLLNQITLVKHLRASLAKYNAANPASSRFVARVMLLTQPLDIDVGEITDKGYVNQRAVLEQRHSLVEQLYSDDIDVILIDE